MSKLVSSYGRPEDPNAVIPMECIRETLIPHRIQFAEIVGLAIVQYCETASAVQKYPKKRSFPHRQSVVESDHKALGANMHAFGAYETTFITIRYFGGTIVRMRIAAYNEGVGTIWQVEGASVHYYQNHFKAEKFRKSFTPDDIVALMKEN